MTYILVMSLLSLLRWTDRVKGQFLWKNHNPHSTCLCESNSNYQDAAWKSFICYSSFTVTLDRNRVNIRIWKEVTVSVSEQLEDMW